MTNSLGKRPLRVRYQNHIFVTLSTTLYVIYKCYIFSVHNQHVLVKLKLQRNLISFGFYSKGDQKLEVAPCSKSMKSGRGPRDVGNKPR
ncbi:hypothetical protein YC2023_059298 [Brassica napus]